MDKSIFIRADELAAELDVSKALAYKMINQWNEELKAKGYTTVGGRVSRQYDPRCDESADAGYCRSRGRCCDPGHMGLQLRCQRHYRQVLPGMWRQTPTAFGRYMDLPGMWTDRAYNKILPGVWHPAPRPEAAPHMGLPGLRCKRQQRKVLQ